MSHLISSEPTDHPALRERLPPDETPPDAERRLQGEPHREPGADLRARPRHEAQADPGVHHPLRARGQARGLQSQLFEVMIAL